MKVRKDSVIQHPVTINENDLGWTKEVKEKKLYNFAIPFYIERIIQIHPLISLKNIYHLSVRLSLSVSLNLLVTQL